MSQDITLIEQRVESDDQWCPLPPDTCEIILLQIEYGNVTSYQPRQWRLENFYETLDTNPTFSQLTIWEDFIA
jgi:hypothetical protein